MKTVEFESIKTKVAYIINNEKPLVTSKEISTKCQISLYMARKVLNSLLQDGLVEKVSIGRPAIVDYGEYEEVVCDAMPPWNGYRRIKIEE